jgi:multidrug resistance efflux pump
VGRLSPVSIPAKRRLHMFCQTGLPILAFVGCAVAVVFLWKQTGNGAGTIGEVFAPRVDVTAQIAGVLLGGPGAPVLEEFMHVSKGDELVRLDPKPLDARIRVLKAEAEMLRAQLDEIRATAKFEDQRIAADHAANIAQIRTDAAGLRADYLKAWGDYLINEIAYKRNKELYESYLPYSKFYRDEKTGKIEERKDEEGQKATGQLITKPVLLEAIRDMEMSQKTYVAAKAQYDALLKEGGEVGKIMKSLPAPPTTDVEKMLVPVQKEMEAKLAEVQEIEDQKEFLIVRAPFDGVVTTVFIRPDQAVQPNMPICTLAATKTEYVLAYVRQNSTLRPRVGMKAEVRFRGSNETIGGAIVKVGAHVEAVSLKQLFDPQLQEWGLPIAIQLNWPYEKRMQELQPRPGEIVFVRVLPGEYDNAVVARADDIQLRDGSVVFVSKK